MYARLPPSDDDDDNYDGDDYNNDDDDDDEGVVEGEERGTGRLQGTPRDSREVPYGSAATRHVLRLRWITYIRRRYLSALFYLLLFLALHCLGVLSPFVPSLNLPNSPSAYLSSSSSSSSISSSSSLISSPPKMPTTVTVVDEALQGVSASRVEGSLGRGGSYEASSAADAAAATVVACADGCGRRVEDIAVSAGRLLPVSEVFTYFLEYLGFSARLLTLLPLIAGCVICLRHLYGHCLLTSPCIKPVLCGIIAGLMGLYGEVLLWLAVTLLRPNPVLLQSQLCCTLAAACCLLAGLSLSCQSSPTRPSPALTPGPPPRARRDDGGGLVTMDPLDAPSAFVYGDLFRPSRRRRRLLRRRRPLALRHDVSPHRDVREGARHRRVGERRERWRYDVNGEVVISGDDDDVEEVAERQLQFLQWEDERRLQASAISDVRAVEEDRRFDHEPRGPGDADSGAWPHLGDCNCPQCHGNDSPASRDRKSPSMVLSAPDRPEDVFNVNSDLAAVRLQQRLPPQDRKRWRSVGDENIRAGATVASGWDDRAVEAASREVCLGPPHEARPGPSHRHDFRQAEVHCPLHNPRGGRLGFNHPPRRRSHPMSSQAEGALVNTGYGVGAESAHHRYQGKVDVPVTRPRRYPSIGVLQHPQQYKVSDVSACHEEFIQQNSRQPSDTKQPRRNRTDAALINLSPDGQKEATLPEAVSIQIDDSAGDRLPTVELRDSAGQGVISLALDPGDGSALKDDNHRDTSKASQEGQLSSGADFDHSTNYIDDDLYYHTSDDDHLETFIVHNSAASLVLAAGGGAEPGRSRTGPERACGPNEAAERGGKGDVSGAGTTDPGGRGIGVVVEAASGSASTGLLRAPVHSRTMTTASPAPLVEQTSAGSSPGCLKATDRSLMLTFYDSQEYLSLTDNDDDDDEAVRRGGVAESTNKTWP